MHYRYNRPIPITEDLEIGKGHLQRLGDCPYIEGVEGNKKAILLFTACGPNAIRWCIRSACWARRSFYLNTDAGDENIQIVFFVDEELKVEADPIFDACEIEEKDVFYYPKPQGIRAFEFKLLPVVVDMFANYDLVMISDADYFACNPTEKKDPYFRELLDFCDQLPTSHYIGIHDGHIIEENTGSYNHIPRQFRKYTAEEYIEMFKGLNIPDYFFHNATTPEKWTLRVSGGFYVFSIRDKQDKKLFEKINERMQDDEGTVAVYHATGKNVYDMSLGRKVYYSKHSRHHIDVPYFFHSHYCNFQQYMWLKHIKAVDYENNN